MAANSNPSYHAYIADAPTIADGGRVKLAGTIRARAGWPTGGESYPIIIELIDPGWIELHLADQVKDRVADARELVLKTASTSSQKITMLQAVDDIFQELTFLPSDGRVELPRAVLAFLGVHPKPQEGATEKRGDRYGGQQLYVQAAERAITVMSLARRESRVEKMREDLPPQT